MGLLILLLIILLLAAAGILGFVVKVALGVAMGLVAAAVFATWAIRRRIRRALYGSPRNRRAAWRWRRVGGSSVEVLDRPSSSAGPNTGTRGDGPWTSDPPRQN